MKLLNSATITRQDRNTKTTIPPDWAVFFIAQDEEISRKYLSIKADIERLNSRQNELLKAQ